MINIFFFVESAMSLVGSFKKNVTLEFRGRHQEPVMK